MKSWAARVLFVAVAVSVAEAQIDIVQIIPPSSLPVDVNSVVTLEVKVNASWTGCYWDFDGETMCSQNAGIPGNNVECDEFRANQLTGGTYEPLSCKLQFYYFEASDSGDWTVTVAIEGSDPFDDHYTFEDIFSTKQPEVHLELYSSGQRPDIIEVTPGDPFSIKCNALNGRPDVDEFRWTFDGDLLEDGNAEYQVEIGGIDPRPDINGSNFGYPYSVMQTLVMTLPDSAANRDYSLQCRAYQSQADFPQPDAAYDTVTVVAGAAVLQAGLSGGLIALIVISVLIFIAVVAFFIFLCLTGRCLWQKSANKKTKKDKALEAERRRRELASARRVDQQWAQPQLGTTNVDADMQLPGMAPPVDRSVKPPLHTLAVAPPGLGSPTGTANRGFETTSSLSYTPGASAGPSSPGGGVFTVQQQPSAPPVPQKPPAAIPGKNTSFVLLPTTQPTVPYQGHSPASAHPGAGDVHFSASYPRKQYRDDGKGYLV